MTTDDLEAFMFSVAICLMLQCLRYQSVVMFCLFSRKMWSVKDFEIEKLWAKASLRACIWPENVRPSSSWRSKSCTKSSWRKLEWSSS